MTLHHDVVALLHSNLKKQDLKCVSLVSSANVAINSMQDCMLQRLNDKAAAAHLWLQCCMQTSMQDLKTASLLLCKDKLLTADQVLPTHAGLRQR